MPKDATKAFLIVDDEPLSLLVARHELAKAFGGQAEILEAGCAQEALLIFRRRADEGRPLSVVISDYQMPKMNGETLLRRIRAEDESVCLLIVSGLCPDLRLSERAPDLRLSAELPKPWKPGQVADVVREALAGRLG